MSNEEFEKRMEFIVEQQTLFIQQLREAQTQTERVVSQTGEIVARLANVTLEGFKGVNTKISALVDSQMRTEESLRNLTAVVDRYVSGGRNGKMRVPVRLGGGLPDGKVRIAFTSSSSQTGSDKPSSQQIQRRL